eukprot:367692_1
MADDFFLALSIDVVGNVILSFLSMNELACFALINKHYHKLAGDLYFYHIKPRILTKSITFPKEIESVLGGRQLWKLYQMFHELSFTNNHNNYWFQVQLDSCGDHIATPLLWYLFNAQRKTNHLLFKHGQNYYTGIGLYNMLSCRITKLPPGSCFGRINLSFIPATIDTFLINMDHQHVVYCFDGADTNQPLNEEAINAVDEKQSKEDEKAIHLWKNIFIGGGAFENDTLDCYDIQKHIQVMPEKSIHGFDDRMYKMDYHCIHLMFNNNKLKTIKNIDQLHPFICQLAIINQWDWNEALMNINLSKYQRLIKINLSGNNLKGDIGDLAMCLPKGLKTFTMNCNDDVCGCLDFKIMFHDSGLNAIEEVVITNCNLCGIKNFSSHLPSTLKILCLNYNKIQIDWNKEFRLTETLRHECKLERLSLSHNKINGCIDLQDMSRWLPCSLYLIDLNSNYLSGTVDLVHFPATLQEFDISENDIDAITIIGAELIELNPERFAGFTWNLDAQYTD